MKVYSIYDTKAEAYLTPFYLRSKAEAIRSFTSEVNRSPEQSQIAAYPSDFVLFELGSFDELTGKFFVHELPQLLGTASEYVKTTAPVIE